MKKIFLLFKNNWRNVYKLKGVFTLLFLIIILFSTSVTIFWEFKRQFNLNIQNSKLYESDFDFAVKRKINDITYNNLFCTDYTTIYDKEKKLTKRFPFVSFNNQNGCFKELDFQDVELDFQIDKKLSGTNKYRILKITNLAIPKEKLVFNSNSIYHQNSFYGLLIKKYQETGEIKHLQNANWIKDLFFPEFKRHLEIKLMVYLNHKLNKEALYTEIISTQTEIKDFIFQNWRSNHFFKYNSADYYSNINLNKPFLYDNSNEEKTIVDKFLQTFEEYEKKIENLDLKTIAQMYNFWFGTLIKKINNFIGSSKPKEINDFKKIKDSTANFGDWFESDLNSENIKEIAEKQAEKILKNISKWSSLNEKNSINKDNYQQIFFIIQKIINKDQKYFDKYKDQKYFQNLIKYLLINPKEINFFAKQIFIHEQPLFAIYDPLYDLDHKIKEWTKQTSKQELLKYFNFNGQTVQDVLENINKQKILNKNEILKLIDNAYTNHKILQIQETFLANKVWIQELATVLLGKPQLLSSNLINKIEKNSKLEYKVFTNFFAIINQKIQKIQKKLIKFLNFPLTKLETKLNTNELKMLGDGFSLETFLIIDSKKTESGQYKANLLNAIKKFKKTTADLVQKLKIDDQVKELSGIKNLNLTDENVEKIINDFKNITNLNKFRLSKWRFIQDWLFLKWFEFLYKNDVKSATADNWKLQLTGLIEDSDFKNIFKFYYKGLDKLNDEEYKQFNELIKTFQATKIEQLEIELLTEITENFKTGNQDDLTENPNKYKISFNFNKLKYQKTFNNFLTDLNVPDNLLKKIIRAKPGYVLNQTFYWIFFLKKNASSNSLTKDKMDWNTHLSVLGEHVSDINFMKSSDKKHNYFYLIYKQGVYIWNLLNNSQQNAIKSINKYLIIKNSITKKNNQFKKFWKLEKIQKLNEFLSEGGYFFSNHLRSVLLNKETTKKYSFNRLKIPDLLKTWMKEHLNSSFNSKTIILNNSNREQLINYLFSNNYDDGIRRTTMLQLMSSEKQIYPELKPQIFNSPYFLFHNFTEKYKSIFQKILIQEINNSDVSVYVNSNSNRNYFPFNARNELISNKQIKSTNVDKHFIWHDYFINFDDPKKIIKNPEKLISEVQKKFLIELKKETKFLDLNNWTNDKKFWPFSLLWGYKKYETFSYGENLDYFSNKIDIKLNKIFAGLYNIDYQTARWTYTSNSKTGENSLILPLYKDIDLFITKGFAPTKLNQIVISPTYAKYKGLKVGDKINIGSLKNLIISGFGTSKRFIYPALNIINIIPQKKDNIIFLNPFYYWVFLIRLKNSIINSQTWFSSNYIFFKKPKSQINKQKYINYFSQIGIWSKDLENNIPMYKNYTEFSRSKYDDSDLKYITFKNQDQNFKIWNKTVLFTPLKLNYKIPSIIYKVVYYTFIYLVTFLTIITLFVIWHLFSKKIEINRYQLGILKALGYQNFFLLMSFLTFGIFILIGTFVGWIIGTILQKPLFELFTDKILFNFNYFYFNVYSFYTTLSVLIIFVFIVFVLYNFFKFKKMTTVQLLDKSGTKLFNKNDKIFWIWRFFGLHPFWRINLFLFNSVAKKIILLVISVLVISVNLLGVGFFISSFYKTEKFLSRNQNVIWKFKYQDPVVGNPFSKYNFYTNHGLKSLKNEPDNSLKPIENISGEMYLEQNNGQFKKKIMNLAELLAVTFVLQNKSFNYNKVNALIAEASKVSTDKTEVSKNQIEFKKAVCVIMAQITKDKNLDKTECLQEIMDLSIPFAKENIQKIRSQFPIDFNNVGYNPENDELISVLEANLKNTNKFFKIFGIQPNTKFLNHSLFKENIFANKDPTIVPIIINQFFADKMKIYKNDKFELEYKYLKQFLNNKNIKNELSNDDWWYYEVDKNSNPFKRRISDLPYDIQFFKGELLIKSNINLFKPDKYRLKEINYQNKIIKILEYLDTKWKVFQPNYKTQRNGKSKFLPYINADNIALETKNLVYWPFRISETTEQTTNPKTNIVDMVEKNKFYSKIISEIATNSDGKNYQFKVVGIVPGYDEAIAYLPHSFTNRLAKWPTTISNHYKNQNPPLYFNARLTKSREIFDAGLGYGFVGKANWLDQSTIVQEKKTIIQTFKNYDLENKYKIELMQFLFSIFSILIVINILTGIFLFGIMVKLILDILHSNTLFLKILGYNNFEIVTQILIITLLPILLVFLVASLVTKNVMDYFVHYMINNYQIYIFYISDAWIFFMVFGLLLLFYVIIIYIYFYNIKKTKFNDFIRIQE